MKSTFLRTHVFFAGPDKWCNGFPVATEGKRQSPIDIESNQSVDGSAVTKSAPLIWHYEKDIYIIIIFGTMKKN